MSDMDYRERNYREGREWLLAHGFKEVESSASAIHFFSHGAYVYASWQCGFWICHITVPWEATRDFVESTPEKALRKAREVYGKDLCREHVGPIIPILDYNLEDDK